MQSIAIEFFPFFDVFTTTCIAKKSFLVMQKTVGTGGIRNTTLFIASCCDKIEGSFQKYFNPL